MLPISPYQKPNLKNNKIGEMPHSFLASLQSTKKEGIKECLQRLFPRSESHQLLDFNDFLIGFNGMYSPDFYYFNQPKEIAFFVVGNIFNLDTLIQSYKLGIGYSIAQKLSILYDHLGVGMGKLLSGAFAILIFSEYKKELTIFSDATGQMPIFYYQNGEELFLTSELKSICNSDVLPINLVPEKHFLDFANHHSSYSFLEGWKKMMAGKIYKFNYSDGKIAITDHTFSEIKIQKNEFDFESALQFIFNNLSEQIAIATHSSIRVGIPLSGGLDSGIIAALTKKHIKNLNSYTIGTELGNEFSQAREAAQFLDTKHTEIFIDNEGFMESVMHGIYLNEFAHPVYAEGYPGFYHIFKTANQEIDNFITGYGADLILGDIYNLEDKSTINAISEHACHHTQWTGEFSPFIANHFNTNIIHPFWNIELINNAISLPWQYKYKGEEVKYVLREMAVAKQLLPKDYAWRKKTAFNVGSSTDKLLAKMLNISDYKDYEAKGKFLFKVLREIFEQGKYYDQLNYKTI